MDNERTIEQKKKDWGDIAAEWFVKLFFWAIGIVGVVMIILGIRGSLFWFIPGGLFLIFFFDMEFPNLFRH